MTPHVDNVSISHGMDVLIPQRAAAYPIPCAEWNRLKARLEQAKDPPWVYPSLASVFIGAALSTAIGVVVTPGLSSQTVNIAAVVVVACILCAVLTGVFAHQQRNLRGAVIADVIAQMQVIEDRYKSESRPHAGSA